MQLTALTLVGVMLALVLGKHTPQMALLVTLSVCCTVAVGAAQLLEPVTELLGQIRTLAGLDGQLLSVLLKAAGIGMISELAGLICADAGEQAMAKVVQLLANAAVLWLSVPLLRELISLVEEVLFGL